MDNAVELADLIWQLRSELTRAAWGGENRDLRFKAEKVELELTVGIEKCNEPNVKVRLWVLDGGAGTKRTVTSTQVIRLTLHPVFAAAPDTAAVIGGASAENEK